MTTITASPATITVPAIPATSHVHLFIATATVLFVGIPAGTWLMNPVAGYCVAGAFAVTALLQAACIAVAIHVGTDAEK